MKYVLLILALGSVMANAKPPLRVVCNVSEFQGSRVETTGKYFNGTLQNTKVPLTLIKDVEVTLEGSPGAVSDTQAFMLYAKITDLKYNSSLLSQGWFIGGQKYSEAFHDVIPGTLLTKFSRENGEKIEVSCFNPSGIK